MLTFDPRDEPRLRGLMTEQGADLAAIADHARRWVCDPSGFTTSRFCLLTPLGEALAEVAVAFGHLGDRVVESWDGVRRDADRTWASYIEADDAAADSVSRLAGRLS